MKQIISKVKIGIYLSHLETDQLEKIAEREGRSRKNLCETEIRKMIQSFLTAEEEKKKLFPGKLLLTRAPFTTGIPNEVMD